MRKYQVDEIITSNTTSEISQINAYRTVEHRRRQLAVLKGILEENQRVIPLQSFLKLTKTEDTFSETYLYRDLELETNVEGFLSSRIPYGEIIKRYNEYDPSVEWTDWPKHYAVRVLAGNGPICSGKNIFSFFPEALRLLPKDRDDVFGLEFIDAWENIFRMAIFPCVRKIFDIESQLDIFSQLELNLSRTIYLAAVFHEMGHRCGPWKVSPHANKDLKINPYHWGIMGEIATDSLLSVHLKEFPEIPLFVTLQRLFWFGRRGYLENPFSGMTNVDNDSWLGSFLWTKLIEFDALIKQPCGKLKLEAGRLPTVYRMITQEIDSMANRMAEAPEVITGEDQDKFIDQWMRSQVPWDAKMGFMIPRDFCEILEQCYEIPEQPYFTPPFSLRQLKQKLKN